MGGEGEYRFFLFDGMGGVMREDSLGRGGFGFWGRSGVWLMMRWLCDYLMGDGLVA